MTDPHAKRAQKVGGKRMPELWSATLNPMGPNYEAWFRILGDGKVPLDSPRSGRTQLGNEHDVEVYLLNLRALTLGQRARLVGEIALKFGTPIYEVEKEIAERGFPIRAVDVIVSFDVRAFV